MLINVWAWIDAKKVYSGDKTVTNPNGSFSLVSDYEEIGEKGKYVL